MTSLAETVLVFLAAKSGQFLTAAELAIAADLGPAKEAAVRTALTSEYVRPFKKHRFKESHGLILTRRPLEKKHKKRGGPAYAYGMLPYSALSDGVKSRGKHEELKHFVKGRKVKDAPVSRTFSPPVPPPVTAATPATRVTAVYTPGVGSLQSAAKRLVDALLEQYVKPLLVDGVADMMEATTRQLARKPPAKEPDTVEAPPPPKVRRPKVLILGLLAAQQGQITAEFGNIYDFDAWSGSDYRRLKQQASNAEIVVAHVRHISHAAESALKSIGVTPIRVTGGLSSMREAMKQLAAERAKANY